LGDNLRERQLVGAGHKVVFGAQVILMGSSSPGPLAQFIRLGHTTHFYIIWNINFPLFSWLNAWFGFFHSYWSAPRKSEPYWKSAAWFWWATTTFKLVILCYFLALTFIQPMGFYVTHLVPSLIGLRDLDLGSVTVSKLLNISGPHCSTSKKAHPFWLPGR